MTLHIRRVVTGHDADGKAVIVADGEAPRSWRRPSGLGQSLCWVTDAIPVDNARRADGGDRDIGIPPPPHGSVFRIVEFPPEGDGLAHASGWASTYSTHRLIAVAVGRRVASQSSISC